MYVPIVLLATPVLVVVTTPLLALPVDMQMEETRSAQRVKLALCVPLRPPALRFNVLLVL